MSALRRALSFCVLPMLLAFGPPVAAAPPSEDDLRFLPTDCQFVLLLRVDQTLASGVLRELPRYWGPFDKMEEEFEKAARAEAGTSVKNIERILLGGNAKGDPVEIIRFAEPVPAAKIRMARSQPRSEGDKATAYKEVRVGKYLMYEPNRDDTEAFCVLADGRLILARAKTLRAILERDKRPQFSADLEAALKLADFSATLTAAFDLRGLRAANGGMLPTHDPSLDLDKLLAGVPAAALSVQVGAEMVVHASAHCPDAATAKAVKERTYAAVVEWARTLVKVQSTRRPGADLVRKVKMSAERETASASVALSVRSFMWLFPHQ